MNTSVKVSPIYTDANGFKCTLVTLTDDGNRLTIAGAHIGSRHEDFVLETVLLGQFAFRATPKWSKYEMKARNEAGKSFKDDIYIWHFTPGDAAAALIANPKLRSVPLGGPPRDNYNPILQRFIAKSATTAEISRIANSNKLK